MAAQASGRNPTYGTHTTASRVHRLGVRSAAMSMHRKLRATRPLNSRTRPLGRVSRPLGASKPFDDAKSVPLGHRLRGSSCRATGMRDRMGTICWTPSTSSQNFRLRAQREEQNTPGASDFLTRKRFANEPGITLIAFEDGTIETHEFDDVVVGVANIH